MNNFMFGYLFAFIDWVKKQVAENDVVELADAINGRNICGLGLEWLELCFYV